MSKLFTIQDAIHDTLKYVRGRKEGTITSMKTGYPKMDRCMIDGVEWNSTITIGGRPSVGKSAVSDAIVEGAFASNLDKNGYPTHDLLDFNWELSARVTLLRRLSAKLRKSYKYIISAEDNTISEEELKQIESILIDHYGHLPITFCEEPLTVEDFGQTVIDYVTATGRPTLVRVDHTLLARHSGSEENQVKLLLNLMMKANYIKKKYPVIFMFLTQINREFEERQEDGSDKAFPRQSDVYGGDASAMFSETIILLNKPSKYGIQMYGRRTPGKAPVEENDLFMHVVKNRNSLPDLVLHYKEDFKNMSIIEC